jgi:hypothetical protein
MSRDDCDICDEANAKRFAAKDIEIAKWKDILQSLAENAACCIYSEPENVRKEAQEALARLKEIR